MRPPHRPRPAALVLSTAAAVLALATFASAAQLSTVIAARTPLPPLRASNPGGRLIAVSARERAESRRRVGDQRLVIPSVGVSARWVIERLDGTQLGVPADVDLTGLWAGGGPISGVRGTVLIDGHVNYVGQGDGALYPLARVKPGALIATSTRSGITVWWRAVHVVSMLKQALPQGIFTNSGPRRLVIVTCGGLLEADGHYDDNVVLYARPLARDRTPAAARLAKRVKGAI
jgi:hypothetical protein